MSNGFQITGLHIESKVSKKVIFDHINVRLVSKGPKLVYLQAPTGFGKSILMEYIAYNGIVPSGLKLSSGKLDIFASGRQRAIGFVPINMFMVPYMTTFDFLLYKAQILIQKGSNTSMRHMTICRSAVTSIMKDVNILHLRDRAMTEYQDRKGTQMTSTLSQGELKRLQIATELLDPPSILLIDEPSSTLDPYTSVELFKTIKDVTLKYGLIVLCTLHETSPAILQIFDEKLKLNSEFKSISPSHESITAVKEGSFDNGYMLGEITPCSPNNHNRQSKLHVLQVVIKRHIWLRYRLLCDYVIWINRIIIVTLCSIIYYKVNSQGDASNYFDQKGVSFFLLMHLQYETLYMAQGMLREERYMYASELGNKMYGGVTLALGRMPAELLANMAQASLFLIINFPLFLSGSYADPNAMLLVTVTIILFLLTLSSMWRAMNNVMQDFRQATWIGDQYINVGLQLSGFWTSLSVLNGGKALRFICPLPMAFQVMNQKLLSNNIYEIKNEIVDGVDMLRQDGMNDPLWVCILALVLMWIFWESIGILTSKSPTMRYIGIK